MIWQTGNYKQTVTNLQVHSSSVFSQGREDGVQGAQGQGEGVQQEGRQAVRQHVREMEKGGKRGEGAREAGSAAYGHRQRRVITKELCHV